MAAAAVTVWKGDIGRSEQGAETRCVCVRSHQQAKQFQARRPDGAQAETATQGVNNFFNDAYALFAIKP